MWNEKKEAPRITAELIYKRSELVYDIENYAYVVGDVTQVEDEHLKHHIFDIAQDGKEDLVTRILNLAYAECVEFLYPYTKNNVVDESLTNILEVVESYRIELSLPSEFSQTTLNLIKKLIHDYMVCRVLTEWFSITIPAILPLWQKRVETIRDSMRNAMLNRRSRLRRRQSMF